ncbi:hypothetical protein [Niallia circulans]|nr:hypothetical protein [Niallia circulans]
MKAKHLDFKKVTHVVIAIDIFVAVVGVMLFAPIVIGAWPAVFLP